MFFGRRTAVYFFHCLIHARGLRYKSDARQGVLPESTSALLMCQARGTVRNKYMEMDIPPPQLP